MPLFEMTGDALNAIGRIDFAAADVRERDDLQRLLRLHPDVLADGLLVIAEEFGDFEGSGRRIDLLCVDRSANLVVVELKRTGDGGHMELQALRYAAMVSAMTWRRATEVLSRHAGVDVDEAESRLLDHLGWDEPEPKAFAQKVRIVLASAGFGSELTTTVLWLNEQGLDIICVQLSPHQLDSRLILDVRQVIPLPEAADFQVKLKEKAAEERSEGGISIPDRREFWKELLDRAEPLTSLHRGLNPRDDSWLGRSAGFSGGHWIYTLTRKRSTADLLVNLEEAASTVVETLEKLEHDRAIYEQELGPLVFERTRTGRHQRVRLEFDGGYANAREEWARIQQVMIDGMIRLERSLRPQLQAHVSDGN